MLLPPPRRRRITGRFEDENDNNDEILLSRPFLLERGVSGGDSLNRKPEPPLSMTRLSSFQLGLVLIVFNLSDQKQLLAAEKKAAASERTTASPYKVVHGWPALPEG